MGLYPIFSLEEVKEEHQITSLLLWGVNLTNISDRLLMIRANNRFLCRTFLGMEKIMLVSEEPSLRIMLQALDSSRDFAHSKFEGLRRAWVKKSPQQRGIAIPLFDPRGAKCLAHNLTPSGF
jgi:hypothetical protein